MDPIFPGFSTSAAHDPNGLFASDAPVYIRPITVVSGQDLGAGTVLGRITTGGKFAKSVSTAADGSQTPVAVLLGAIDASGGDKQALAAFTGAFKQNRLIWGDGHTPASAWQALAARRIFLHDEVVASEADTTPPAGYTVEIDANYTLGTDADAAVVNIAGAEPGGTFTLTITSSGGGTAVVETGDVEEADFSIEDIDLSGLTAGTLTAKLVVTDANGNAGLPAFDTATLAPDT
jgi:hypothetical protein